MCEYNSQGGPESQEERIITALHTPKGSPQQGPLEKKLTHIKRAQQEGNLVSWDLFSIYPAFNSRLKYFFLTKTLIILLVGACFCCFIIKRGAKFYPLRCMLRVILYCPNQQRSKYLPGRKKSTNRVSHLSLIRNF